MGVNMTEESLTSQQSIQEMLTRALQDISIPEIHFNGFVNGVTPGDIVILLLRHGRPVAKLAASYTVAKTLAELLGQSIVNLEHSTGNTIMTSQEIEKALQKGVEQ
jgi:antitoxin (DNA-binding transcriptional repressor) of toxin-antitoxin stability system